MATEKESQVVPSGATPKGDVWDSPQEQAGWEAHRRSFSMVALILQILLCVIYACCADYGDAAKPQTAPAHSELDHYYPLYQDIHVMIFIGFGFLMTFLKKYGFSSVGYNFVLSAFVIQWGIVVTNFSGQVYNVTQEDGEYEKVHLGIHSLIEGDFASGCVLITMGAVLGKTNPLQLLVIALLEVIFYAMNFTIGCTHLQTVDMGGSMFVHTFGAYFGLGLSRTLSRSAKNSCGEVESHQMNGSSTTSDMFAMIGTIFLWMFWPSFNGGFAHGDQQYRVVINTVLSLSACCVTAFAVDNYLRPGSKFSMVSIQNATLAGGVAVGSSSDLIIHPWGAILIGCAAGMLSVVGYVYIQPWLEKRLGLDDTCGVHNLHGMPGILGGLGGAIASSMANEDAYGASLGNVFSARVPISEGGEGRTAGEQASFQVAALVLTVTISIFGGIITGLVVKLPVFKPPLKDEENMAMPRATWYLDEHYWETEEETCTTELSPVLSPNGP
jgi:ammonium transporter Rh